MGNMPWVVSRPICRCRLGCILLKMAANVVLLTGIWVVRYSMAAVYRLPERRRRRADVSILPSTLSARTSPCSPHAGQGNDPLTLCARWQGGAAAGWGVWGGLWRLAVGQDLREIRRRREGRLRPGLGAERLPNDLHRADAAAADERGLLAVLPLDLRLRIRRELVHPRLQPPHYHRNRAA